MGLRSKGKQLSFEILASSDAVSLVDRSNSDPFPLFGRNDVINGDDDEDRNRRKRREKKKRKKKAKTMTMNSIAENGDCGGQFRDLEEFRTDSFVQNYSSCSTVTNTTVCEESESGLRQRNVNGGGGGGVSMKAVEEAVAVVVEKEAEEEAETVRQTNGSVEMNGRKLETAESLDWRQLITDDSGDPFPVENSPRKFFIEEMRSGNSLRSTTISGNDKERERVYDTIFRLPWSLLTAAMTIWKSLIRRQQRKLSAADFSDFGCLFVLAGAIALLGQTDISLIYHMIRGQGIIKLYVVYNVLEIFDKLWQSFGGDVFQTFFSSAEGLACCPPEASRYWIERYTIDLLLAAVSSILIHSFILLAQAITLSTCIVAHNNALFALLVSNNFAEIKSNVFKRFSKDNVHSIVYADSIERFHITAFMIFVLAQNIQEAEGSWFGNFLSNALLVYFSEMAIDIIKHSFIAKFNDIKPITYSEFLEDLCKQTLNAQTDGSKRSLTFIPVAPACVVIRVLTPVYAARLPCNPFYWRLFWILCLTALTYVMLLSLKIMVGMGLQKHASWYVKRCQKRKLHSD